MTFNPSYNPSRKTEEYFIKIKKQIKHALDKGPQTLEGIIRACEGAYPTVVEKCLEELGSAITIANIQAYQRKENVDVYKTNVSSLSTIEGNPVLCSWYFTSE